MHTYNELGLPLLRIGGRPPLFHYKRRTPSDRTRYQHTITLSHNEVKTVKDPDDFTYEFHCPRASLNCTPWVECTECTEEDKSYLSSVHYKEVTLHGEIHKRLEEGWLTKEDKCAFEYVGPGSDEVEYIWRNYGGGTFVVDTETFEDGSWMVRLRKKVL